jgi:hypothetical protein
MTTAFRHWSPIVKMARVIAAVIVAVLAVATLLVVFAGQTHHSGY